MSAKRVFCVRLDEETIKLIRRISTDEERNTGTVVRRAVRAYLRPSDGWWPVNCPQCAADQAHGWSFQALLCERCGYDDLRLEATAQPPTWRPDRVAEPR